MYIDYCCYDYSINEVETTNNISKAIKLGIKNIFILPYTINYIKQDHINNSINFGCPVDFPYGLSDLKTRNFAVENLAKSKKIKYIDLMIPTKTITNRKYDKFREDIKSNLDICNQHDSILRYVLEYRVYSHEVLNKICQILKTFEINTVLPSTGMMLDNINDNIIACKFLQSKSKINTICNGNIYLPKHVELIKNSQINALRISNIFSADLII